MFPITDVWGAMIFCALFTAIWFGTRAIQERGYLNRVSPKPIAKVKSGQDWDEEFLRTEAKKHVLVKIDSSKLQFKWSKPGKSNLFDGFTWACECGDTGNGLSLEMAERTFAKHKENKRAEALAQLGRFK